MQLMKAAAILPRVSFMDIVGFYLKTRYFYMFFRLNLEWAQFYDYRSIIAANYKL